ncbi:MAG: peptidase M48 [Burkholderiales bacterium RIFOXYC2_FULL_59_8]|nr:MAG: peptidase M48 [Burkholderiales bacterium RIFOXYC2_FULL_59_8]OGB54890.1 MAG: peptidase M48 [Burkholderiales bacterium RIFOXYD12_FULL_59_19]OGB81956.1 MAG: peptidase M48 [Burkholderiales bacterium RIFOXYC12_FULL_60_6]OGB86835.1 MAG: peptidase M48 [Burkholderiales bacterium RIFOXYD2_FULL_59_8]
MTHSTSCLCCRRRPLLRGMALLLLSPGLVLAQGTGRDGVAVGGNSVFSRLVPADTVEQSAAEQYAQMLQQAAAKNALGGKNHPQVKRLRAIARRIIPHAVGWNPRAASWRWEVNLIGSQQINAFCMPGGKIAFYSGILDQLKLTDAEVANVMGHEVAHALREHARERMGKNAATGIGANLLSNVLGLGQLGQTVTSYGAQLLTLQFSRSDESEADLVGMELAARAGFDPRAGVTLWQKMAAASKGAPPQWLSTHPSGNTRIADIQANLPKVLPLYARSQNK